MLTTSSLTSSPCSSSAARRFLLVRLDPAPGVGRLGLDVRRHTPLLDLHREGDLAEMLGVEPQPRLTAAVDEMHPHRADDGVDVLGVFLGRHVDHCRCPGPWEPHCRARSP